MLSPAPKLADGIIEQLQREAPGESEVRLLAIRRELTAGRGILPREDFENIRRELLELSERRQDKARVGRLFADLLSRAGQTDQAIQTWRRIYDPMLGRQVGEA